MINNKPGNVVKICVQNEINKHENMINLSQTGKDQQIETHFSLKHINRSIVQNADTNNTILTSNYNHDSSCLRQGEREIEKG